MTEAFRIATLAEVLSGVRPGSGELTDRPDEAEPDVELARRCCAGDEAAHTLFAKRYARLVFALCRRRGLAPDVAEDLTQDVLADAIRGLRRFRGEARLSSWIFGIACRHLATYFRSPASRTHPAGVPGDDGFPGGEPADERFEERLVERDRAHAARRAVERLEEPARTILLGFYLAELSVREIAEALSLPEGTVKSHLHRGRRAVRARLEPR